MKIFAPLASLAAAAAVAAVFASAGAAVTPGKTIPFSASYSGTVTYQQTDNIVDLSANGTGTGTLLGASKIAGTGRADTSAQPCVPFTGPGTMTGVGGKLGFVVLSGAQGCGDETGQVFSVVGKAKVTSATGKLKKAAGTLKLTGTYDRGAGTFTVKFKGTLTQ